jgi:hypothetical protein
MRFPSFPRSVLRRAAVAVVLGLSAGGCYSYTPIEGATPPPGLEVRLALSDEGSVRMAPLIGPRIGAIDGRSIESTDTALVLAVEGVVGQGGRSMGWSLERLSVPRSAVSSVRTKTFDHKKTWAVAGLTVVGALLASQAFGIGNGFDGVLGGGGGGGKK